MALRSSITAMVLIAVFSLPPAATEAGGLGKAVARGATKSVSKSLNKGLAQTLRRDLLRDRKTPVRVLRHDRHVFRYTTKAQARREIRSGLRPGTHMTSRATAGRPLSSSSAQRRYGIPKRPQVRETIHLQKGVPVRSNRVVAGKPGIGETTSPKRIPAKSIEKVVSLK